LGFDLPVVAVGEPAGPESLEVDELGELTPGPQDPAYISNGDVSNGEVRRAGPVDPPGAGAAAIAAAIETLRRKGFGRLLVEGRAVALDDVDPAALASRSALQVVVDRVQLTGEDLRQRLTDSVETAYLEGGGAAWAVELPVASDQPSEPGVVSGLSRTLQVAQDFSPAKIVHQFSELFECRECGITYEDPQPRLFSFNNPFGACPTCHGFGNIIELDMDLVVPDKTKSIQQ